jgi:hypothetical protein
MPDGRMLLAVLIDADNIPAKYAGAIMREITTYGEPALRRVYGDWSSSALAGWKKEAADLGMVLVQETANTKGKNASDIGLVIDAMDILHTDRFGGFVLVSSDSDFTALARRLREDGGDVIGIGEEKAPASLRNACNRFVFLHNIISAEKVEEAPRSTNEKSESKRHPPSKVVPMVIKAMRSIDPEGEWYQLGQLGQFIVRDNPDFDPRTYGSPKLSDLLQKTGAFEVAKREGQRVEVRRPD